MQRGRFVSMSLLTDLLVAGGAAMNTSCFAGHDDIKKFTLSDLLQSEGELFIS